MDVLIFDNRTSNIMQSPPCLSKLFFPQAIVYVRNQSLIYDICGSRNLEKNLY